MCPSIIQNKDQFLFSQIKNGDEKAYEQLFRQYYAVLTAFAYTFVHDLDLSESIVQNVFVRLWEKRKQYEISSVKSYLYMAVKNSCHNEMKRVQHERDYLYTFRSEDAIEMVNYPDSGVMDRIIQTIELLPEQRRKIFKLNRLEGLKYREIAERLHISCKTVEAQMGKALKFLRGRLGELKRQVYHAD